MSKLALHLFKPVKNWFKFQRTQKECHVCFRETLRLSDGGHICLDWCNEKDDVMDNESCRPTVIILPGLAGQ